MRLNILHGFSLRAKLNEPVSPIEAMKDHEERQFYSYTFHTC